MPEVLEAVHFLPVEGLAEVALQTEKLDTLGHQTPVQVVVVPHALTLPHK